VTPAARSDAPERAVAHNRAAHDALGASYDEGHPEIFNPVEQERLGAAIRDAVALAARDGRKVRALDVGCGTGNVTRHLIAAGATVTAADLAHRFLDIVRERFPTGLDGVLALNGHDLRPAAAGAFDLVVAYSVLHHVPDYLTLVRDMVRVTAPGGIVVIDHERSEASWASAEYAAFLAEAVVWPPRQWWYWLQPARYWKRIRPLLEWRRWGNPRWMPEGDIHIWPDDHIEWTRIEETLVTAGCGVERREQYLLFEPRYRRDAWEAWKSRASDMQLLMARRVR
jgi:2-polyprenyl-3-methyl-5-hydroxy-6-metoxy-1,4-benzoquinol methylase